VADASVLALATHTSGLTAWQPLYTLGLGRGTLLAHALLTPPGATRGSIVYSDLGFIVLGHLVERVGGQPLAALAAGLFERLGVAARLGFTPGAGGVAPTEECPSRGRTLRGEVHDENAFPLGGAAGHAGLFGTARG
jgi:CubicO group peptidase (beta-lactamase class C family)